MQKIAIRILSHTQLPEPARIVQQLVAQLTFENASRVRRKIMSLFLTEYVHSEFTYSDFFNVGLGTLLGPVLHSVFR